MTRWAALRLVGGLAVLAALVWRLGTGPFLDGLRHLDLRSLLLALLIGVPTTVACAWRWREVAAYDGVPIGLRTAVAAYYRSQLLNGVLPAGVLGDVERAVRHGTARSVVLDRVCGQVVQVAVAGLALLTLPGLPLHALALVAGIVAGAGTLALLVRRPVLVVASLVAVAGHLATFVLATRTAGVGVPLRTLLPLALLVLVAMVIPANIAGFGPREGVAAWAFAALGYGAAAGVGVAVVYGVLTLVAAAPGMLDPRWSRRAAQGPSRDPVELTHA